MKINVKSEGGGCGNFEAKATPALSEGRLIFAFVYILNFIVIRGGDRRNEELNLYCYQHFIECFAKLAEPIDTSKVDWL